MSVPPSPPSRVPLRRKRQLVLVILLLVLLLLYFLNPVDYALVPKCPFKLLTGFACPGCGIQRAVHAALHGAWAEAWAYNRFLIYSLPYLFLVMLTEWLWRGERRERWRRIFEGKVAILLYIVLFFSWGLVRNILHI